MADIVLDHVTKRFPDGASPSTTSTSTIADGEFVILVGPSGCGKSTTLNMIAGLEDISERRAAHRRRGRRTTRRRKDRDIAHGLPELRPLSAHDRAREHGVLAQAGEGGQGQDRRARSRRRPRSSTSPPHLDRKPANLSGGQRQRVAMGRAIVRDPERVPDGRAAVEPRRQAARADAHRGLPAAEAARHDDRLRHPRPDRGDDARRPGRGHARRRDPAGRPARGAVRAPGRTSSSPASSARRP